MKPIWFLNRIKCLTTKMHTKMDFSDKTKEIIDAIVQETLTPIMAQEKQDSEETKMSEAVKQWIDDKQGKFNGKEI